MQVSVAVYLSTPYDHVNFSWRFSLNIIRSTGFPFLHKNSVSLVSTLLMHLMFYELWHVNLSKINSNLLTGKFPVMFVSGKWVMFHG